MANRYWVGGTDLWDGTAGTKWALTSGGTGGQAVPTAADDVFFDGSSGANTITISTVTALAKSITCTGFTGTIDGTTALTVSGSITLVAGMTWGYTGTLTVNATGTLTSAGKSFANLTKTGLTATLTFGDNFTCTGALTFTAGGTIDLNSKNISVSSISANNTSARTLNFGASGVLDLTGTGTIFNNSLGVSIVTSGSRTVNVTNSGSTAITLNANSQSTADSFNLNVTGGTYALTMTGTYRNVDFTGFAGTLNNGSKNFFENLKISTGMTLAAGGATTTFVGTGTQDLTTNGKTFDFPINQNGVGGTLRLLDSLTVGSTRNLSQTNGTINLNGQTLTVGNYSTNAGTKNITFNGGVLSISGAGGTAFNNANPTNFTTTAGTGAGEIRMTSASAKTFVGGGSTFNCTLTNNGAGAMTITGSNTFTTLANGVSPTTITFTAATTTTLTNWSVSGTSGNLVTINSATAATHTLSKTTGTVSADYLNISYSVASGGAAWYAGANSTDGGNNTGWIFSAAPSNQANFFLLFM